MTLILRLPATTLLLGGGLSCARRLPMTLVSTIRMKALGLQILEHAWITLTTQMGAEPMDQAMSIPIRTISNNWKLSMPILTAPLQLVPCRPALPMLMCTLRKTGAPRFTHLLMDVLPSTFVTLETASKSLPMYFGLNKK